MMIHDGSESSPILRPSGATEASATSTTLDPCVIDLFKFDLGGNPDLAAFYKAGWPWVGAILQASNGLVPAGEWFTRMWQVIWQTVGSQLGVSRVRGAYHYYVAGAGGVVGVTSGRKQADVHLDAVQAAGGMSAGDLWTAIDIEAGEQPPGLGNQQIIDEVSAFSERVLERTGRLTMRYSGSYVRDRHIVNKMGCELLWVPDWDAFLPQSAYVDQGYSLANTWGWQGVGDGNGKWANYPTKAPVGAGGNLVGVDITAIIINGGGQPAQQLPWTLSHLGSHAS